MNDIKDETPIKTDATSTIDKIRKLPDAGVIVVYVGKEVVLTALGTVALNEFVDTHESLNENVRRLTEALKQVEYIVFWERGPALGHTNGAWYWEDNKDVAFSTITEALAASAIKENK